MPLRMVIIKRRKDANAGMKEREPLCATDEAVNWNNHHGKQERGSSKY